MSAPKLVKDYREPKKFLSDMRKRASGYSKSSLRNSEKRG